MTPAPRIARVEITFSESNAVPRGVFRSLAHADAALAAAFAVEPPPSGGAYYKTSFRIVWTDGQERVGRVDVTQAEAAAGVAHGGIILHHLRREARWMSNPATAPWLHGRKAEEKVATGRELLRRLDAEPSLGTTRNLHAIPEDQLLPIGTTADSLSVTLLPDPFAAVAELEAHFAVIRPAVAVWMGHGRTIPHTTNADVTYAANWLSLALAHDLPRLREKTGRSQGVIWDRWAKTVEHVRRHLGSDPDATYRDNPQFWSDQVQHLADKLQVALQSHTPRNGEAGEGVPYRVTSRRPDGSLVSTYHTARDYLDAKQRAAFYLGYQPEIVSVDGQYTDGTWSRV